MAENVCQTVIFEEVDWFYCNAKPDDPMPEMSAAYRTCDGCYYQATDDIWRGVTDEAQWRRFYHVHEPNGCDWVACEQCLVEVTQSNGGD